MIKKNWKVLLITSIVILLPILAGILLWDRLPDQIPAHWNAQGQVDGWCSKPFFVLAVPFLMLALQWLCVLATSTDPKKTNHTGKVLQLVLWIVPLLGACLNAIAYCTALGTAVRVEVIMPVLMGLMFAIIGNYLPKCQQNYTIGIKLPWTLSSEENWTRTHRLTGRLWVVCGLVTLLTGFLGHFWMLLVILAVMVIVPLAYSYALHRKGI